MSVYKSKNSPFWQYDFQINGRRFHGSTGQVSKAAAKNVEARKRREMAEGPKRQSLTVDEMMGEYWRHKAERQKTAATTRYQMLNLIAALRGDVADITTSDLMDYARRRRAKVSDSSVNREIQLYRRAWKFCDAADRFEMGKTPNWGAIIYPEPKERVRSLTDAEQAALLEALRDDLKPFIAFAIGTGARLSTIIRLRWSDVDLASGRATLAEVKGGGSHSIPLTPELVALIANQPKVGPYVFTYVCQQSRGKRRKGERYPLTPTGWRRAWAAALAAAEIEDFRFHDLRHTAATQLLRATGNIKLVQRLLGHQNIATTARYAHADDDDLRVGMAAVRRAVPE